MISINSNNLPHPLKSTTSADLNHDKVDNSINCEIECPIIMIGSESSGKSSMVNAILGTTLGLSLCTTATTNITIIRCQRNERAILPKVFIRVASSNASSNTDTIGGGDDKEGAYEEVAFPFVANIEKASSSRRGMEKMSSTPLELLFQSSTLKRSRMTLIDCPGFCSDNKMENGKILSIISKVMETYEGRCILLCCFSNHRGFSKDCLDHLKLSLPINSERVYPIFTKVDDVRERNQLVNILLRMDTQWCSRRRIFLLSVPHWPEPIQGSTAPSPSLQNDVSFYTEQSVKSEELSQTIYLSVKNTLQQQQQQQQQDHHQHNMKMIVPTIDHGLSNLMASIEVNLREHDEKIQMHLEAKRKELSTDLQECEKKLHWDWNSESKVVLLHDLIKMFITFHQLTKMETNYSLITQWNAQYGILLSEELKRVASTTAATSTSISSSSSSSIRDLVEMCPDRADTKLIGYLMLARDEQWIGNLLQKIPIAKMIKQHTTIQEEEEEKTSPPPLEPSFKRKCLNTRTISSDVLLDLWKDGALRERMATLMLNISKMHLTKVRNMIILIMECALDNTNLNGGTHSGSIILESGINLLDRILKGKDEEFSTILANLFMTPKNYLCNRDIMKEVFMNRVFGIVHEMTNMESEWGHLITEHNNTLVEGLRMELKKKYQRIQRELDSIEQHCTALHCNKSTSYPPPLQ